MNIRIRVLQATAISLSASAFLPDRFLSGVIQQEVEQEFKKSMKVERGNVYKMIDSMSEGE